MYESSNAIAKQCSITMYKDSNSFIGHNVAFLRFKYNIDVFYDSLQDCKNKLTSHQFDVNDTVTVSMIRSLLGVKSSNYFIEGCDNDDIEIMLAYLSVY